LLYLFKNLENYIKFFYIVTLGCSKNEVISEKFIESLSKINYIQTKDIGQADYIIINSCGFIEDALNETIEETIISSRQKKKNSKVILTGCAANLYKQEFKKELKEADLILNYEDFYEYFSITSYEKSIERKIENKNWEYLLISEGCSKKCTYCTIPLIKGPYRSFSIEQLIEETKILYERNINELILISQDTAYYGKDSGKNNDINLLKNLIEKIYKIGIKKIRLLYFNLDSIEENNRFEFIKDIFSLDGVIPYFEIPLQNLVDSTLKRMGRKINFEEIEFTLNKIKEYFDKSVIRTSIITGFPGETQEDFSILNERLLKLPIDYLNVFAYSDMDKAPSYRLNNKVSNETAIERRNILLNTFENNLKKTFQRFIGLEDEIYIEGEDDNYYFGRIWAQTPDLDGLTYILKDDNTKKIVENNYGKTLKIKITDTFFYDFYGEII